MVFVAASFPFEPKLAGFIRIQIVFDFESHVAGEPLGVFAYQEVMVGFLHDLFRHQ